MTSTTLPASSLTSPAQAPAADSRDFTPRYWLFSLPAVLIVAGVIVFPWLFTLYMSTQDWKIGGGQEFVGLQNFVELARDPRFIESIGHTLYFTLLAVVLPIFFGTIAALIFNERFPLRGFCRAIFILPAASIAGGVVLFFGVRTVLRDIAFVAARTTATHPVVKAGI